MSNNTSSRADDGHGRDLGAAVLRFRQASGLPFEGTPSNPSIFISTHRMSDTGLDEMRGLVGDLVSFVQGSGPNPLGLNVLLNDEGTELTLVDVLPGADAMDAHVAVSADRIGRVGVAVYGAPGSILAKALQMNVEAVVDITVHENRLAGFFRVSDAA